MLGKEAGTWTRLGALIGVAMVLVGCAGTMKIKGRVVGGPVGVAVVVDHDDERLSEAGIAGVDVSLLREDGGSAGLIAKGLSDAEGNFVISLRQGQHPGGAVVVRTKGDGVFTARSRTFLPSGDQRLLCTVIENKGETQP